MRAKINHQNFKSRQKGDGQLTCVNTKTSFPLAFFLNFSVLTPHEGAEFGSVHIISPGRTPFAIAWYGSSTLVQTGVEDVDVDEVDPDPDDVLASELALQGACCKAAFEFPLPAFFSFPASLPVSQDATGFPLRTSQTATLPSWLATANLLPSALHAVEKHELVGPPP